jgi:hypothetical protein
MTNKISKREHTTSRAAVWLAPELEKRLSSYASAALAASVSLMAITKSAEAKIVYTPADIPIAANGGPVFLDLNHDGVADFILSNIFLPATTDGGGSGGILLVSASGEMRNQVWGRGFGTSRGRSRFASALHSGFPVRANRSHLQKSPTALMAFVSVDYGPYAPKAGQSSTCAAWPPGCVSLTGGQWMYTKHRYLGLQLTIKGEIHYGWARVEVSRKPKRGANSITARLRGYAYETIPNKPITTGKTKGPDVIALEPVTLGRLGQGAAGIPTWRGKK